MLKRLNCLLILVLFVTSCSTFGSLLSNDLTEKQSGYIKEIIVCDSRGSKYNILTDEGDISDYFSNDDYLSFTVKYEYKKSDVTANREIMIHKVSVNGVNMFAAGFKKMTFPGSDCRKLKTEWRQF